MENDVWNTWHDESFDCNKYLYHYTSIEKALKILFYRSLRFNIITKTNDTMESKIKIDFSDNVEEEKQIIKKNIIRKYMEIHNANIQLLCFSTDTLKSEGERVYTKEDDRYYIDVSGRGFALPRMWAQYADNNCGVCFIINKEKFEKEIQNNYGIVKIYSDYVDYKDVYSTYKMPYEIMDNLFDSIENDENTILNAYIFLSRNIEYVKYSYFTKYSDWMNEREYRYLIGSDNDRLKEVKGIEKYLEGIVLGENIDSFNEYLIKSLLEYNININEYRNIELKKIHFDYNCNYLEEIEKYTRGDCYVD